MPVDPKYRLVLGQGPKSIKLERRMPRIVKVKRPSLNSIFRAFKATAGSKVLTTKLPGLASITLWKEIASFSVCAKSGTAKWLDIWDCDHFDGFTDMQRCITDCRAWFSADGFATWGSGETTTGRVNCYFQAPSSGVYVCNVQLESYPSASTSVVECLIDVFSFGPLPFSGTITQPHVSSLVAGYHHFRIRQMVGGFFFLNLTVYHVG